MSFSVAVATPLEVAPDEDNDAFVSEDSDDPHPDGTAAIDLVCVYYGDSAIRVLEDGTATIIDAADPDFLVVSNNPRRRTVSDATTAVLLGVHDGTGACKPFESERRQGGLSADDAAYADHVAWVRIADGQLQWVFYGCSAPPNAG